MSGKQSQVVFDMSVLPGVGEVEPTKEELELVKRIAHSPTKLEKAQFHQNHPVQAATASKLHRVTEFFMPTTQRPYRLGDGSKAQQRLDYLYNRDKRTRRQRAEVRCAKTHSMVVVCAESLYSDASDTLVDTPLQKDERIIMYICGGGFVSCDAPMERFVYEHISERLQMRLFVPRYGTAPQYCYPQPVHDVYTTLMYLISRGFRSQDIVLLGLSAGGNIAVALMNLLAMGQNESQVAGCILVSPFLDLAMEGRSWQTNRDNCVIVNRSLRDKQSMPRMYFGRLDGCLDGYDRFIKELRHPLMSPVFGDLERLPLVQVHVGSHEVMLDDSVTFCERMGNDRAELFVYEGKNHYSIIRGKQQLDQVYGHMRRFVQQLAQAAN